MSSISEGLKFLHAAERYHGNLKLSNVLVYGEGRQTTFRLTDFEGYPGIGN